MQKKTVEKTTDVKATTAVKAATPVKETEVKAVKEVKAEEKKTETTETKKAAAKKAPAKKAAVKKELVPEVYIQFEGKEDAVQNAITKAKEAFVADGHRESTIKSLRVYLKPEESAAYYVINEKYAGKVDLF